MLAGGVIELLCLNARSAFDAPPFAGSHRKRPRGEISDATKTENGKDADGRPSKVPRKGGKTSLMEQLYELEDDDEDAADIESDEPQKVSKSKSGKKESKKDSKKTDGKKTEKVSKAKASRKPVSDSDSDSDSGSEEEAVKKSKVSFAEPSKEKKSKATSYKNESIQDRLDRLNRMARGEVSEGSESSSSEEEGNEETAVKKAEAELNADTELVIDPEAPDLNKLEYIPDGSETRRLAIVGCDWDNLRAVDILAALQSFVPSGGAITSVTIYPSDYGMKRIEEEAKFGPTPLFGTAKVEGEDSGEERGEEERDNQRGSSTKQEEFDPARLRAYELNKMKYYYAVASCDSVSTAIHVYSNCDGMEFEASSNVFDLRFVPDDTEFTNPEKDVATHVPENYEPAEFATAALQSSKVELTWDAEDPKRARALDWSRIQGKTTDGDGDDDDEGGMGDVRAYLASSESESEEEEEEEEEDVGSDEEKRETKSTASRLSKVERRAADRDRMRALLLGELDDDTSNGKKKSSKSNAKYDDGIQISFTPGLGGDIVKNKKKREAESKETTWEAYQRTKKEKKKEKRAARKVDDDEHDEEDGEGSDDGDGIVINGDAASVENDEFFVSSKEQKPTKESKKARKADDEKRKAELQLLTLGEDDSDDAGGVVNGRNYDLKTMVKQQKAADKKSKKQKHGKEEASGAATSGKSDDFAMDTRDTRFAAALSKPEFSVDPTAPEFKNTAGMRQLLDAKRSHGAENVRQRNAPLVVTAGGARPSTSAVSSETSADVRTLAASVKSKFGAAAPPITKPAAAPAVVPTESKPKKSEKSASKSEEKQKESTEKPSKHKDSAKESAKAGTSKSKDKDSGHAKSKDVKKDGTVHISGGAALAALLKK
jgi:hypothetical protein